MTKKLLQVLNHPALQHKLGILRNKRTTSAEIRQIICEISMLIAYEASRQLSLESIEVETPMGVSPASRLVQSPLVVSILRAGNSMLDGVLAILSDAKVGHIGIYRDKLTQNTVEYYFRLPSKNYVKDREVFLIDPLVATGDTILSAIERLRQFEVGKISVLCLLISGSALARIEHFYPEVSVFTLGIEDSVNGDGYLMPGIGDVSSRLYGWPTEDESHALG
jgi:uracil phosphoribosyltransferase